MYKHERIEAFVKLGDFLNKIDEEELNFVHEMAKAHNGWFTQHNVETAIRGVRRWLKKESLEEWLKKYDLPDTHPAPKKVGIVMAGNIPLVGFHDFLSVLITGNSVQAKLSHQDPFLQKYLVERLINIEPRFRQHIEFVDRLSKMDAVIATGSNNTSRYFEYYFGKYPHIIRKNRTSCAILTGEEAIEDFKQLGKDVFYYFGLGCRNVSKLYVPKDYDFKPLVEGLGVYMHVMDNHKYVNNYHYNRSIFLVNQTPHIDTGFCLLQQSKGLASPVSVLYFDEYLSNDALVEELSVAREKIQCLVSKNGWFKHSFSFGQAQEPQLLDYADHIDTMKFLMTLN